ncbi:MAG: hypothetical protein WCI72_03610 [archaeon]
MLTDWETYKAKDKSWEELRARVFDISGEDKSIKDKDATFSRSLLLKDTYICAIWGYEKTQRVRVQYVGIDLELGEKMLESELGFKLEVRPGLERILTAEEIEQVKEIDRHVTPSPNEI